MKKNKMFRLLFAFLFGLWVSVFSFGSVTVHAETRAVQENAAAEQEAGAVADGADNAGSGAFLIMGGMLLLILAVVITVVATFVVTAPIADEV